MGTYIILSRLSPQTFEDPKSFKKMAQDVSSEIKRQCPGIKWKQSFAVTGRFDLLDIVEAPDLANVERAAMIIRAYGHAATETMVATPWDDFLKTLPD